MAKIAPYKGKVKGPDHKEGGVNAKVGKKPVAEIEGEERIFSKEDTKFIENACEEILAAKEVNPEQAIELAATLGFKVCEMVQKQDYAQSEEDELDAANSFSYGEDS